MNSRERVETTLNYQEPDRVPMDLGSAESTGIAAMAYHALKRHLGIKADQRTRVSDVFQMLADVEGELVERLRIDIVKLPILSLSFGARYGAWRPWQMFDGTPILIPADFRMNERDNGYVALQDGLAVARMPKNGYYFDTIEKVEGLEPTGRGRHALGGVLPDPEKARYPMAADDELRFVEHQAQVLYQETDKALMGDFHLNITEIGSFEDWFILLVTEGAYVSEFYSKQTESIIENLMLYHQAVGDRLTAIYFGQDFGTQQGPMIAPATFRALIAPHYKRVFDWIHTNTAWKVFFHTCGSVYDFIPDFIQMGVDILNPIQTGAARMHPADLKKEFGHRLCFWGGGVDVQRLPFMSVAEVRQQVREHLEALAPGGGFVFSATHNIQANTPPENILTAFESAYECGQYT